MTSRRIALRDPLGLSFVDEEQTFAAVETADALIGTPEGIGRVLVAERRRDIYGPVLNDWLAGRVIGPAAPRWPMNGYPIQEGPTKVCRVGPAWWFPRYGVLIDEAGRLPIAPAGAACHNWPMLDPLPGVSARRDTAIPRFKPPGRAPHLPNAAIALPWGVSNYGHFLLDGLTATLAVQETGLLDRFPLLTPPLRRWQRALLRLAFPSVPVQEIVAPVVRLDGAVFSTAMDHFLHIPGPLTLRLRERVRERTPPTTRRDRRLYVSRRGQHMRIMVDEAALEAALVARGFDIIRPERLAVADQIRLFKEASLIVGPSGAGLANALFAEPGAKVIEIQPENFASAWTTAFCRAAGLDWRGYICASPAPRETAPWPNRLRRGFRFAYRLDVEAFLACLDPQL